MSYLVAITLFHTALCFIAIGAGAVAVAGLCQGRRIWTGRFLALATAVSVTGYFFPFHGVTPAMIVGAIALGVIVVALAAYRHFHLEGVWARHRRPGLSEDPRAPRTRTDAKRAALCDRADRRADILPHRGVESDLSISGVSLRRTARYAQVSRCGSRS